MSPNLKPGSWPVFSANVPYSGGGVVAGMLSGSGGGGGGVSTLVGSSYVAFGEGHPFCDSRPDLIGKTHRFELYYFGHGAWQLRYKGYWAAILNTRVRPTTKMIAEAAREIRRQMPAAVPNTLGWRTWIWDGEFLSSPHQGTIWHEPELRVETWDNSDVCRGKAGIHALRVPRGWKTRSPGDGMENVAGIVERFGNYVLGEDGWRAEWVVIKAFVCEERYAPSLRSKFPEVEVNTIPNVENPFIRNDLDMDFQRRSRLHAQANASLANAFAIQMNQPKPAVHLVMTKGFWARWVYDSKQFIVDTWKDGWVARSLMFLCALQLIICTVNIFVQLARLK